VGPSPGEVKRSPALLWGKKKEEKGKGGSRRLQKKEKKGAGLPRAGEGRGSLLPAEKKKVAQRPFLLLKCLEGEKGMASSRGGEEKGKGGGRGDSFLTEDLTLDRLRKREFALPSI